MDIYTKRKRRVYKRASDDITRFMLRQKRYFMEAHRKAEELRRFAIVSVDRFTLCFD